ncbi:MAG: hypothetical protein H0W89_04165 [Candidatus Levybacteria bacterium]|nr:hypothetical protein [Candidatus Levybacteria bacterium]
MLTKNVKLNTKNIKRKVIYKTLIINCTVLFLVSQFFAPRSVNGLGSPLIAYAALSSDLDYSIEFEELNTDIPEPTPKLNIIENEFKTLPAEITPTYSITSTNDTFSFSISQTAVDFGALTATNPVIRTSNILFSTPTYGSQIMAYANHPLMNTEKITIPDSTCDTGICSQTIPANWEDNLTYGFGFRCESASVEVCGKPFSASNSFKHFADTSANEFPQSIMLNQQGKQATSGKITYKVNISGTQQIAGYSNTVTYIAIPNF